MLLMLAVWWDMRTSKLMFHGYLNISLKSSSYLMWKKIKSTYIPTYLPINIPTHLLFISLLFPNPSSCQTAEYTILDDDVTTNSISGAPKEYVFLSSLMYAHFGQMTALPHIIKQVSGSRRSLWSLGLQQKDKNKRQIMLWFSSHQLKKDIHTSIYESKSHMWI